MFEKIKNLFKKEKTYPCIVWNGKNMSYLNLNQKQIDEINSDIPKYKNWHATINEEG